LLMNLEPPAALELFFPWDFPLPLLLTGNDIAYYFYSVVKIGNVS
jgi:hypothetical protein